MQFDNSPFLLPEAPTPGWRDESLMAYNTLLLCMYATFTVFYISVIASCLLPEAPTPGWRDESLMAYNTLLLCMYATFTVFYISVIASCQFYCLKLPLPGGVTSR